MRRIICLLNGKPIDQVPIRLVDDEIAVFYNGTFTTTIPMAR